MDKNQKELKSGVSILMLTYNRANYIHEAVSSVLTQTYRDFELIIIDDGSTDDTATIISTFTDPRIRYYKNKENRGLVFRRKESVGYADREYLAVLDSDDFWTDETKLEKQIKYLKENPRTIIIGSNIINVDSEAKIINQSNYQTTDRKIRNKILKQNQFAHSACLMCTTAVKDCGGYKDFSFAEDLELFLRLGIHGQFANLPQVTTAHRIHGNSVSSKLLFHLPTLLSIIDQYQDQYPGYFMAKLKYKIYYYLLRLKKSFGF